MSLIVRLTSLRSVFTQLNAAARARAVGPSEGEVLGKFGDIGGRAHQG